MQLRGFLISKQNVPLFELEMSLADKQIQTRPESWPTESHSPMPHILGWGITCISMSSSTVLYNSKQGCYYSFNKYLFSVFHVVICDIL